MAKHSYSDTQIAGGIKDEKQVVGNLELTKRTFEGDRAVSQTSTVARRANKILMKKYNSKLSD